MKEQIEEMAKHCPCYFGGECCFDDEFPEKCDRFCQYGTYAEILYNAGYRKQEWISVEDRFPDNSDQILIYLDNGNIEVGYYDTDNNKFHHILPMPRVTHWMPLPEPPKMKGGE